jgi:membrane-bound metal-dependent hydrolase YbcI (DUF457 family)
MNPLGHLSISYMLAKALPSLSEAGLLAGGVAPDFDFALIGFPWFGKIHRVVTHNLFFAAGAGLVGAALAPHGRRRAVGLGVGLGALVHLLVDGDMLPTTDPGGAVALFYPLDRRMVSRYRFKGLRGDPPGWKEPRKQLLKEAQGMHRDLPLLAAAVGVGVLAWWLRRKK